MAASQGERTWHVRSPVTSLLSAFLSKVMWCELCGDPRLNLAAEKLWNTQFSCFLCVTSGCSTCYFHLIVSPLKGQQQLRWKWQHLTVVTPTLTLNQFYCCSMQNGCAADNMWPSVPVRAKMITWLVLKVELTDLFEMLGYSHDRAFIRCLGKIRLRLTGENFSWDRTW